MLYHKIDLTTGLFIEDTFEQSADTIDIPCPEGFYHPKWDFTTESWVEGLTVEETEVIKASVVTTPTIEERTEVLESALLEIIMGGGL